MRRRILKEAKSVERRFRFWMKQHNTAETNHQAEMLPLRRDMVTLLSFVRDNRVVGTQSRGNMPLKSIRQVTACFVEPPKLKATIGDHTYKLRSEADLWPLYFLHILAEVGGLLKTAPARRWRLTSRGEDFLDEPPLLQVSLLFSTWWHEVNWLVAYPFEGMGEALPPLFNLSTLAHLRSLPIGIPTSFEEFADALIEETALTWTATDSPFATISLRSSIRRMVIDILAAFGGLHCEYREKPLGKTTIPELVTFKITPFGKGLLDFVAMVSAV